MGSINPTEPTVAESKGGPTPVPDVGDVDNTAFRKAFKIHNADQGAKDKHIGKRTDSAYKTVVTVLTEASQTASSKHDNALDTTDSKTSGRPRANQRTSNEYMPPLQEIRPRAWQITSCEKDVPALQTQLLKYGLSSKDGVKYINTLKNVFGYDDDPEKIIDVMKALHMTPKIQPSKFEVLREAFPNQDVIEIAKALRENDENLSLDVNDLIIDIETCKKEFPELSRLGELAIMLVEKSESKLSKKQIEELNNIVAFRNHSEGGEHFARVKERYNTKISRYIDYLTSQEFDAKRYIEEPNDLSFELKLLKEPYKGNLASVNWQLVEKLMEKFDDRLTPTDLSHILSLERTHTEEDLNKCIELADRFKQASLVELMDISKNYDERSISKAEALLKVSPKQSLHSALRKAGTLSGWFEWAFYSAYVFMASPLQNKEIVAAQ